MSSIHPMQGRNANISATVTKLTDGSLGTASDAIPEITGSYVEADLANSIASLAAKVNAILDALEAYGITDASGN